MDPAALGELCARRGRVKVPWRLVSGDSYPDVALSVYIKTAALAWRPEGCTAAVTVLARYLRLSASAVERGLRALSRPGPADGVVELTSRRRTKPGGLGTTAERRVRPVRRQEAFVWVPVVAAELLEPRQLRAWAALAYANARNMPVSEAELGEILVHHSGKRAGQPIGAGAASAVVDALEALGWLRVHRRKGRQARHVYEVLELPVPHPDHLTNPGPDPELPSGQAELCSGVHDGSGSPTGDGSLATEEDPRTDGLVHEGRLNSSAVGEATVVAREQTRGNPPPRSAAPSGTVPSGTAGLALRADDPSSPASRPSAPRASGAYTGILTVSPRLAWVMAPVTYLLQRVSAYVQRAFARQLGSQLADGVEPERLRARLQARFARTSPHDMRSVEGWLLKVAAARWGCYDPRCEEGVLWHSGQQCTECLSVGLERKALRERQRLIDAGLCPDCRCPVQDEGPCRVCRPSPVRRGRPAAHAPTEPPVQPAVDTLSTRCRNESAIRDAEITAMDAACAGLSGGAKITAAAQACAYVRARVTAAREAAVAAGLSPEEQEARAAAAAVEAAGVWAAANTAVQAG
ncbi:type II toxin-antitoxin system HicA family toxin [Streptomyces venezuelae]|uniref:type II toxin-antitoxin system HicA family toxin n=1 Tax=Streptomyces venezuelae TaxID=54571 RepID=UPI003322DEE9